MHALAIAAWIADAFVVEDAVRTRIRLKAFLAVTHLRNCRLVLCVGDSPERSGPNTNRAMDKVSHADPTPTLVCARVRLVPFGPQHMTATYVGWLNDPVVVRYSEQRHRAHTLDTCRAYFDFMQSGGHHFWAVERTD